MGISNERDRDREHMCRGADKEVRCQLSVFSSHLSHTEAVCLAVCWSVYSILSNW